MAKIREYENDQNIHPNELGVRATANAAEAAATSGYRIAQMQRQTGAEIAGGLNFAGKVAGEMYTRHVVQPEIAQFNVVGAGNLSDLTVQWNELAAKTDPNDTTIADKFREKTLLPTLEKMKSGMQTAEGQKHAEDYSTRMLEHFNTKMLADTSHRAGAAVAGRVETLENKLSTTALNDPSAMDTLMKMAEDAVKGEAHGTFGLTPAQSAQIETALLQKMQKNIAQSTLYGIAKNDPQAAMKALESGKFSKWLNGVEEYKALHTMSVLKKQEDRAAVQEKKDQLRADVNKTNQQLIADSIQPDGSIVIKPSFFTAIRDNAGKFAEDDPAHTRAMIQFGQSEQQRDKSVDYATNPDVFKRLSVGLATGETTLTKIVEARNQQELSSLNMGQLVGNLEKLQKDPLTDPVYHAAIKAAEQVIAITGIPGLPGRDEVGAKNYAAFINTFTPAYIEAKRTGKLEANALNVNDPTSMISKVMGQFQRTTQDKMKDYAAGIAGLMVNPDGSPISTTPAAGPKGAAKTPDVPQTLSNRGSLAWSPKQNIWVDQTTRERFNKDGSPVK